MRDICFANCVDEFIYLFIFQSFEMFSLLLMTFIANPLFLLYYYRHMSFHFILYNYIVSLLACQFCNLNDNGVDGFLHFISRSPV